MNPTASINKMFRLLFFKISRNEMLSFNHSDLLVGFFFTWIVGVGRYWDDPGAKLLQHAGVGSVVYIFILSFFIWLLLKPFHIKDWSYSNLLTFISLTSAPALLYAIPVERFLDVNASASINAYFLLTVAGWRVALLIFYLRRFACITRFQTTVATLLPLTVIVTSLSVLNLERAVFEIMGGFREQTSNDTAYMILNVLTFLSVLTVGPLIISYGVLVYRKYKAKKT